MRLFLLGLFLLASCRERAPQNGQAPELPVPSGPPVAQQADAVPSDTPQQPEPMWETAVSADGMGLRLVNAEGKLLLSIACLGSPRRLQAAAPGFSPIGSEDRFSLGLGDDPVTLVADLKQPKKAGVIAEAPAPPDFGERLQRVDRLTALYGTQQIGPVPSPSDALKETLARACIAQ